MSVSSKNRASDCGDCFTGCNVRAKNTLYMNYLPFARSRGVDMFAQVEVSHMTKSADGKYILHYRVNQQGGQGELQQLRARHVILAAGSLGSTEVLFAFKKSRPTTLGCAGQTLQRQRRFRRNRLQ